MSRLNKLFHPSFASASSSSAAAADQQPQNSEAGIVDGAVEYAQEHNEATSNATDSNSNANPSDELNVTVEKFDADTIENLFKKIPVIPSVVSKIVPTIAKTYIRQVVSRICNVTQKTTNATFARGIHLAANKNATPAYNLEADETPAPAGTPAQPSTPTVATASSQTPVTTFPSAPAEAAAQA